VRKVIGVEWVALDGVMQAPGFPDEDRDGGFEQGGWHMPYFDVSRAWVVEGYEEAGGFLFGRRTFELLAGYWPNASEQEQAVAIPLNAKPKYVASATLTEPLSWEGSALLAGDVAEAVAWLRAQDGGDLHVIGSSRLLHTLLEHDLIDGFRLMIDPIALGHGKRLFDDNSPRLELELVDSRTTTTGALLATYARVT
jgi:dihydrofolate reductase